MKKLLAIFAVAAFMFAACGNKEEAPVEEAPVTETEQVEEAPAAEEEVAEAETAETPAETPAE